MHYTNSACKIVQSEKVKLYDLIVLNWVHLVFIYIVCKPVVITDQGQMKNPQGFYTALFLPDVFYPVFM